jgi:hypothetical protein
MTAGLLNSCKDLGRDFVLPFGVGGKESDGRGGGTKSKRQGGAAVAGCVPAATGTEGPKDQSDQSTVIGSRQLNA